VLNERLVGKIYDFEPIPLSETGRAVWRPLVSVKETLLLKWVSLDFSHRAFKHAPLLHVPLCVSRAFLVFSYGTCKL